MDLEALSTDWTGHGGGDGGLIATAIDFFREDPAADLASITPIDRSVESHYVAFAAEESRAAQGTVVEMAEFCKRLG